MSCVLRNDKDLPCKDYMTSLFQGIQPNFKWTENYGQDHPSLLPEYFYTAGGLDTPSPAQRTCPWCLLPGGELCLFLSESLCSCCPAVLMTALLSTGREGGRMTGSEKQREIIQASQETKACWMLIRRHRGNRFWYLGDMHEVRMISELLIVPGFSFSFRSSDACPLLLTIFLKMEIYLKK